MLLISSSMLTVLPTPAPPNRPILPPLANGQTRSITLMPVSSSSIEGDSSSKPARAWWIARRSSDLIGPPSSIGRPSTSMMRPSVPMPTGTLMPSPVPRTCMPRFRPSLEPIAMVRTTPSPSCCWTSKVSPCSTRRLLGSASSTSASYTCGMCSRGNSMSTTAPMHWTICPLAMIALSSNSFRRLESCAAFAWRPALRDRGAPPTISEISFVMPAWRVLL